MKKLIRIYQYEHGTQGHTKHLGAVKLDVFPITVTVGYSTTISGPITEREIEGCKINGDLFGVEKAFLSRVSRGTIFLPGPDIYPFNFYAFEASIKQAGKLREENNAISTGKQVATTDEEPALNELAWNVMSPTEQREKLAKDVKFLGEQLLIMAKSVHGKTASALIQRLDRLEKIVEINNRDIRSLDEDFEKIEKTLHKLKKKC